MLFKDMKKGYGVFFLDRDSVEAYQGKVVSVAVPRYDAPVFGQMTSPTNGMVVDVTIEAYGLTKTYTIPEGSDTAYAGSLVISPSKEAVIREVEAIKTEREELLGKVDKYRSDLSKCESILEELNPELAEKREQDKRIEGIESKVDGLVEMVRGIMGKFSGEGFSRET